MNRYHFGAVFCVLLLISLSFVFTEHSRTQSYWRDIDTLEREIDFSINCATKDLKKNYRNANYVNIISDSFFRGYQLINQSHATLEELYTYIPFILYYDEYGFYFGHLSTETRGFVWNDYTPYPDGHSISTLTNTNQLISLAEAKAQEYIDDYNNELSRVDYLYTLPDFTQLQPKYQSIVVCLEGFPIAASGKYLDMIFHSTGSIQSLIKD